MIVIFGFILSIDNSVRVHLPLPATLWLMKLTQCALSIGWEWHCHVGRRIRSRSVRIINLSKFKENQSSPLGRKWLSPNASSRDAIQQTHTLSLSLSHRIRFSSLSHHRNVNYAESNEEHPRRRNCFFTKWLWVKSCIQKSSLMWKAHIKRQNHPWV